MPKALSAKRRGFMRLFLGGCLFLGAGASSALAQSPSVAKMLEYQPRQEVAITTPSTAEQAGHKVELDKDARGSAWVLKDSTGRLVRRYYSSTGKAVDGWHYYKDGVEVYREVDTTGSGRPDQYRWLNAGGSRWGVDVDKDGKIDGWKAISPEEVSQEILRSLATRNFARFQALLISEDDVKALGMPKSKADDLAERRKGARAKFDAAIAKLTKLGEKAVWVHLELPAPESIPADQSGARGDLLRYPRGTVLFELAGANEWFQVGPMIQVGAAWKVIDAPAAGATTVEESGRDGTRTMDLDPAVQKLVEDLTKHDKTMPSSGQVTVKHHLDRADILEKIVAAVKASERDPWIRQVADSLASAAQVSAKAETAAITRLGSLEAQLVKAMPASNLTAYIVFRKLQAEYSRQLSDNPKDFDKIQEKWLEKLTAFVKDYPKADDTPDAMLQLGMVCEFLGKETEAKNWYTTLAKTFADKPQGQKAAGCVKRLALEGEVMTVSAPLLENPATTYSLEQLKGKIVIVYYWASWNGQAVSDFARLKAALTAHTDVALLAVNLDNTAEEAKAFLKKNPLDGIHLYQSGALESKVANQYGITILPGVFVVGKDGKCVNKNAQANTVEDDIKKLKK